MPSQNLVPAFLRSFVSSTLQGEIGSLGRRHQSSSKTSEMRKTPTFSYFKFKVHLDRLNKKVSIRHIWICGALFRRSFIFSQIPRRMTYDEWRRERWMVRTVHPRIYLYRFFSFPVVVLLLAGLRYIRYLYRGAGSDVSIQSDLLAVSG